VKCRACTRKAVIKLPSHNSAFCPDCFDRFVLSQVGKAIEERSMIDPGDHVLVAVSGGKDSLALWEILMRLGYRTTGFHLDLGIGDYSRESRTHVESFASRHGLPLTIESLRDEVEGSVSDIARATRRPACSGCGLSKRYFFNRTALRTGATVLATGHNLDDEASRLFGNLLHWHDEYLAKNRPDLPSLEGLSKKVKPLVRLTEKEMASYAFLRKIPYVLQECPHSADAKQLLYKKLLNEVESESPGTKHAFLFGFLDRIDRFYPGSAEQEPREGPSSLSPDGRCEQCGEISWTPVCSFCRLKERVRTGLSEKR
jgi:uncharacterized protein (TIGR00269 family)